MTVRNASETVKRLFPNISYKEIWDRLSSAQKLYARLTRCTLAWIDETALTGAWYHLGDFMSALIGVYFLDANGKMIDPDTLDIYYHVTDRHILFLDSTGTELPSWPSSIVTLRLRVRVVPADITSMESTFTVAEDFHDFILSKVLGDLYLLNPTTPGALDMRNAHLQSWSRGLMEGKKYANIGADELTDYRVRFVSYAGA